jgi:hypothetical protein
MSDEILGGRRKALEESFFAKENERLRQALKQKEAIQAKREALAQASGIKDDAVLDELLKLDIGADTLAALTLVPLVEVAWADGGMDDKERSAILSAAEQSGLHKDSPSYALLQGWLRTQPQAKLLIVWKDYVASLSQALGGDAKARLRQDILGRARSVAEAAGGFLGLGSKISSSEQAMLGELERAFR